MQGVHENVLKILLEHKADVNATDRVRVRLGPLDFSLESRSTLAFALQQEGHSALHGAGEADCMENVLLLLEASADPTASLPHFSLPPYPLLPLSLCFSVRFSRLLSIVVDSKFNSLLRSFL